MFEYEGTLYRPPSEADALIIQVTIGCAHNTCTFCTMYKEKKFRIRDEEEIIRELDEIAASRYASYFTKCFFADGDALVLPTDRLIRLMEAVFSRFAGIRRVTVYGTASEVLHKSEEELKRLQKAGLDMIYIGAESGDDEILKYIHKDVTCAELIASGQKLNACGIKSSVTLISGLGGRSKVEEHAKACAELITGMRPTYCSFLTLRIYEGTPMYDEVVSGRFERITDDEVLEEMEIFLNHVDSPGTVFRSNHASNYLPLAGTFNEDIPNLIRTIEYAKQHGFHRAFRETGDL